MSYDSEPDYGPEPCGHPGPDGMWCGEYDGHENWGDRAVPHGNWFSADSTDLYAQLLVEQVKRGSTAQQAHAAVLEVLDPLMADPPCTCGHPDYPFIPSGSVGQCPMHDTGSA